MEVILKNVQLRFGKLFEPGKPHDDAPAGSTGKYAANGIMDESSEAYKLAHNAFLTVAKEKFGDNWKTIVQAMERSKKCIRKGDDQLTKEGEVRTEFAGKMFIVASNKTKPATVDDRKVNGQFVHLTEADGKIYDGCIVNMKVDIYAMKAKGKVPNGVYATLKAVQWAGAGTAFGSGPATPEGFDEVEGDDPFAATGGAGTAEDDDIPF